MAMNGYGRISVHPGSRQWPHMRSERVVDGQHTLPTATPNWPRYLLLGPIFAESPNAKSKSAADLIPSETPSTTGKKPPSTVHSTPTHSENGLV